MWGYGDLKDPRLWTGLWEVMNGMRQRGQQVPVTCAPDTYCLMSPLLERLVLRVALLCDHSRLEVAAGGKNAGYLYNRCFAL